MDAIALVAVAALVGLQHTRTVEIVDLPEVFDCHAAGRCHELCFGFEIDTTAACAARHSLQVKHYRNGSQQSGGAQWTRICKYNQRPGCGGQLDCDRTRGPCGWSCTYELEYNRRRREFRANTHVLSILKFTLMNTYQ